MADNVCVMAMSVDEMPLAEALADSLSLAAKLYEAPSQGLALCVTAERLELRQFGPDAPGPVYVDFVEGAMGHRRRYGGGRGQLVAKAVGVKKDRIPSVVDATAGLGRDSFVLAQLGCQVAMVERSPVVAALLKDGMARAESDEEVAPIVERMSLNVADAAQWLIGLTEEQRPDVVYVDPMHPERTKAAVVKKEMRLFRELVGCDEDDAALLKAALAVARKRVVVKRPRKAVAIPGPEPSLVMEGKSTRYDIYLMKV
ncbi:class I SAM-dependent methyltransferase [Pseudomonadota bacterium]